MSRSVLHGDCRELMSDMEGCSVDAIVTDPPYELGFMGREWDSTGVAYDVETWRAAWTVLKPGGFLLAFGGSRTYHRLACAIEDAGFDIRDQIMWIYGSGFPKGGNRDGKGTCLKPSHEPIVMAHEPIVMARKPCIGSARSNMEAFGTGALNIDACRVKADIAEMAGRSGTSTPNNVFGAGIGQEGMWQPSRLGRWPANVIHDGSDEVIDTFPTAPGQQGDLRGHTKCRQSPNGIFGGMRPALDHAARGDSGSAARFFYCAKASKADRDEGCGALPKRPAGMVSETSGQHLTRRDDGYEVAHRGNHHPTVKPEALMRYLVRLVTPAGGTVLDPFTGSGSTGKAAVLEGCSFIGCELTAEYLPIAEARIAAAVARVAEEAASADAPQADLFAA